MSDPEVAALKTLEELVGFKKPQPCAVEPLRDVKRGEPDDPKILFCLDTMGGSLEDGFLHGCEKSDSYRFHHWHLINSFVYFSHHLVTIPPPGWISAGHKHGVKVLGTFAVESGPGAKVLSKIRKANLVSVVASQLAHIAASCKFDGWLINIKSGQGFWPLPLGVPQGRNHGNSPLCARLLGHLARQFAAGRHAGLAERAQREEHVFLRPLRWHLPQI
ncbi:hypothetical protein V5799_025282 [Amblyomma americanum]|uniref:Cytosolic endo-beta-N-acetylglucosaminidase TIM barrel domain-containing protein n=1 Tax=Amblyomma americanum TaxID=6943 RepID=A0AAQ4E9W3_AMBAM